MRPPSPTLPLSGGGSRPSSRPRFAHDPRHQLRRQNRRRVRPRRLGAGQRAGAHVRRRQRRRLGRQCGEPRQGRRRRHQDRGPARARLAEAVGAAAGARRAADSPGAALERQARARRRRRGDRRHRALLPRAPQARAEFAVRRHHRHQRQIDHHRADRAPHPVGGPLGRARRQYRHRGAHAASPARRPRACRRVLVLPDRSRAIARSAGRHPDQRQRGSSRPPRHAGALRGGERAAGRRRAARRRGGGRRRRRMVPRRRRPDRARRPPRGADFREAELAGRHLLRIRPGHAGVRRLGAAGRQPRRHRLVARTAQCAERLLRQRRGARARPRRRGDPGRSALLPRPRAPHGTGGSQGRRAVRQRFQGDQRGFRGAGAGLLQRHILDRRRQAQDRRHRAAGGVLSPHPQGLPDRRGGGGIRQDAGRQGGLRDGRHARSRGRSLRAGRGAGRSRGAGGAAVPGLRLVRPVSATSRCAAPRSATWCWRCRE